MAKEQSFIKKVIITCVVVFLVSASATLGFLLPFLYKFVVLEIFFNTVPTATVLNQQVNVLVLGIDATPGVKRSDTIMLLRIDPRKKLTTVISVPRDTIVAIPGRGLDKINHAYAYGGVMLSRKTMENFLQLSIPYYISIDVKGLERIIDALGGIDINVEKRMYYVDYAGGLYVNLYPGRQKLKGRDAVSYVRYRRDGGDLKRISRQQKFIRSLGDRLLEHEDLFRSPSLLLKMMANVKTNLSVRQVLGIAAVLRACRDAGKIKMVSVPGSDLMLNGVYYWQPDLLGVEKIKSNLFLKGKKSGSKKNS